MPEQDFVLEIENITKTYPGVVALQDVSFRIERGKVHCLVGENGAGKTTLIKILAGAVQADAGQITLNGQPVATRNPHAAQQLGLSFIFQELNVVNQLTVADNLTMGIEHTRLGVLDRKADIAFARRHLERLGVDIDPRTSMGRLSVAQKQMVEIARALSTDASIIVMDEPSAPLTDRELETLFATIRKLRSEGVTILYVSHRLAEILSIGDNVTVLRDGHHVTTAEVASITQADLVRLMVGRDLKESFVHSEREFGEPLLVLHGVSNGKELRHISLTLRAGEIVGVAGLAGAGRTELARLIFGADPVEEGEMWIAGDKVLPRSPHMAIKHGIGLVPEERRTQGIVGAMSVRENIDLAAPGKISRMGVVNGRKSRALANEYVQSLSIRTPSLRQKIANLSGGNQQKCVVARWLATDSRILLMDEPTRGIDVGAKAEMFAIMDQLAGEGKAIIMISSEMEELLGMSDRILVMNRGRIVADLPRSEATQEIILEYAAGDEQRGVE
jgi:ribose transport system ATP-binding protein